MAAVVVAVAAVLLLLLYLGTRKPRGFPPGPTRLPIVGFVPFLHIRTMQKQLCHLSSTYGSVIGLYFGNSPVVVVNGWDAVKESLLNDDLNGRQFLVAQEEIYKYRRGIFATQGELWKEQRRFTLHHFRNLGFGKRSHESIVHEEITDLMQEIRDTEGSISLQAMMGVSNINILWALMGGTRYGRKDPRLWDMVDSLLTVFRGGEANAGLVDTFRFLRHVMPESSTFGIIIKNFRRVMGFIEAAVEEHKNMSDPDDPKDFIDIYLKEMSKHTGDPNTTFTDPQLVSVCTDIFTAGIETTSANVSFAILITTLQPHIMTKIQQELDDVVGRARLPSLEDRSKLVYTEAVLNEVSRLRTVAPLAVPHMALRDTTLQGHRIPVDTVVMNNLYSVHMDPEYWGDPETFRPERFINPDGSLRREERLISFGKGRRVCLGEPLARMTVFLVFTSLLQHFTFTLDPAVPLVDMEGKLGFTLCPPDYRVFTKPRM